MGVIISFKEKHHNYNEKKTSSEKIIARFLCINRIEKTTSVMQSKMSSLEQIMIGFFHVEYMNV